MTSPTPRDHRWSFLTNHARALACIAADPNARLRDIAAAVGVTERAAGQIVADLERAGYITKRRNGRRNEYALDADGRLRHPKLRALAAAEVVTLLLEVFERQPLA